MLLQPDAFYVPSIVSCMCNEYGRLDLNMSHFQASRHASKMKSLRGAIAGPMGPFMPIIPGPVPLLPPGPMPMRGRGPRPLRGRGMPGRGMGPPKIDPRGMREYFDLDHPANNRAVLDYGDL